jgi:CheY-like chemotaxis protein
MRVLLVEDDPDIQLVARTSLNRSGFTVTVTSNGPAALEQVRTNRPDVILLDWMMPDMDGPEVCRRLKDDPATSEIPIIFLTARSQQSEIARGLALGATGYIVKPFDALALGTQVREMLAR